MYSNIKECLIKNSINPKKHVLDRYIKLIEHCSNIKFVCYTETHHIIPRSLGGTDDESNLIKLSARHHYIAHLLLAKGTNNPKMIKALHKMVYSTTGDVKRSYKISSKIYSYVREKHAAIVSNYSKNTVVAKHIYTGEIKRIPKTLFHYYNGILYEALAKGRKDSADTKRKKQISSKKPRKALKGTRIRSLAASKYSYLTPKGYCENSRDLLELYNTFTKNTLTVLNDDFVVSKKFASIHTDFKPYVGKKLKDIGFTRKLK